MTTIAIDKNGTIAADGLACFGDELHLLDARKIEVREGYMAVLGRQDVPPRIYAVTGPRGMMDALIGWYEQGADARCLPPGPMDGSGWSLAVIEPTRKKTDWRVWHIGSNCPYRTEVRVPFAWGSGSDYAKGALYAGCSAKEAVEIACKLDTGSGGTIQVVDIAEALGLSPVAFNEAAE